MAAPVPALRILLLLLLLLPPPPGAHGEVCTASHGLSLFPESCPDFCCGTCYDQYCCSDVLKKFVWTKERCAVPEARFGATLAVGLTIFVLSVVAIIICFTCSCCCLYKTCRRPRPSKCAAQLPWTKLPGLPHHATSARDASSTLPNAVPTTLPGPTHGPAGLPRDPGWRSSRALPCQPASLQPGLRGCPEGGPLSVLRPLWLPLGYVVCEWCAGTVPYVPAVLCVSCLYMWLPLMLTRWGMILARVGWDQDFVLFLT
uniref:Protein shisa-5 n=1 Tax=Macaca fascicularis TaxID=9541 RepID=A0A7N9CM77_MACFA